MTNAAKRVFDTSDVIMQICNVVTSITGVQLGDRQKVMVQSRLKKRIFELNFRNEGEYFQYLLDNREAETQVLVSLLTTHHTYFFREPSHFDYLIDKALPALIPHIRKRYDKTLRIWSAACSKGQEVYSISMLLAAHMKRLAPDLSYEIWGTDVDAFSVKTAKNGVYNYNEIKEIPASMASGHWARGTGDIADFVKAKPSIKDPCHFEVCNLIDFESTSMPREYDIIFCRNVFIYFTPEQIKDISSRLFRRLTPQGVMFIGISESLNGMDLPIEILGPSIYAHKNAQVKVLPDRSPRLSVQVSVSTSVESQEPVRVHAVSSAVIVPSLPNPLRVLCVDDSNSVLMLLKQILKKDHGFEVVGTASNGIEAASLMKTLRADVMTLDIHMPQQDGVNYLKSNFSSDHPPVVMISSATREDGDLAIRCLEYGASDYIEKPSLRNIIQQGEEIRNKLKSAWRSKKMNAGKVSSISALDKSFATKITIKNPDNMLRIVVAGLSDHVKLKEFFSGLKDQQPPTLLLIDGAEQALPAFVKSMGGKIGKSVAFADAKLTSMSSGTVQVAEFHRFYEDAKRMWSGRTTSIVVYGGVTDACKSKVIHWGKSHLIVEDVGNQDIKNLLRDAANEIVPHTSFSYLSTLYLSRAHG